MEMFGTDVAAGAVDAANSGVFGNSGERLAPSADQPLHAAEDADGSATAVHANAPPEDDQSSTMPPPAPVAIQVEEFPVEMQPTRDTLVDDSKVGTAPPLAAGIVGITAIQRRPGSATSSGVADMSVHNRGTDGSDRSGERPNVAAGQSKKKKEQQGKLLQILTPLEQQLSPAPRSMTLAASTDGSAARDINEHPQQRRQGHVEANVLESGEGAENHSGENEEEDALSVCVALLDDESDDGDLRANPSRDLTEETTESGLVLLAEVPSHSSLEGTQTANMAGCDGAVSSRSHTFLTEVREPQNVETLISSVTEDAAVVASEWIECVTEIWIAYYYNKQTIESQWTPPAHWIPPTPPATTTSATIDCENATAYPNNALFEAAMGVKPFASQLESILESGVNVHGQDTTTGSTPLHVACQYGNVHAATLLLHCGADANGFVKNHDRLMPPPLPLACRHNHTDVMQLLLDHGASWAVTDDEGNSLLHVCIAFQSQDALLYLLNVAASTATNISYSILGHRNHEDETPLHVAVEFGCVDAVRALLRYGASIDAEDSQGCTPLVLSIMENQVECVQLLQTQSHGVHAHVKEQKQEDEESDDDDTTAAHGESSLEQLQSYLFQVLTQTKGSGELSHAVYQFVSHAQHQIRALIDGLQVECFVNLHSGYAVKRREERHVLQLEALTSDLTRSQDELAKVHDSTVLSLGQYDPLTHNVWCFVLQAQEPATQAQDQLQSHEIELESLRTSHQALASRCELLDSIARASQDKLKREHAEDIRFEEHLQTQLQASMDENAGLLAHLTDLQNVWSNHGQQVQEQHYTSHGSNNNSYDYAVTGSTAREQDASHQNLREAYNLQSLYP
ncbi:hypothetical protein FI667_g4146, partial [Globisporangium splendens]